MPDSGIRDGAGAALGGVTSAVEQDWFAPSQYSVMRDEQRLSAPNYERMDAGVSFGAEGVKVPDPRARPGARARGPRDEAVGAADRPKSTTPDRRMGVDRHARCRPPGRDRRELARGLGVELERWRSSNRLRDRRRRRRPLVDDEPATTSTRHDRRASGPSRARRAGGMTATLFLPWLRRGIGQAIADPDTLSGPLALRPDLTAFIELADDEGGGRPPRPAEPARPRRRHGLAPGQVVRCEPTPGTTDYEATTCPTSSSPPPSCRGC